jgi:hypothetical protein
MDSRIDHRDGALGDIATLVTGLRSPANTGAAGCDR